MLTHRTVSAFALVLLVACSSSGGPDGGPGDADGASHVDSGAPDATDGSNDDADGGEVEDAEPRDADAGDTGSVDVGEAGVADADGGELDAADAAEPDADGGDPDTGLPDADADAGEPDADAGALDAESDAGYHRVTVIGPWNSVTVDLGAWSGDCPVPGPVTSSSCTLWVEDDAFVQLSGVVPGHCYFGSSSLLCGAGASPSFTCINDPTPPVPTSICDGRVNGDLTVSYSLIYDGAFSPCAPPPTSCPSTLECGSIGTLACGTCAPGTTCSLDAFSSACVPSECP